MKRHPSTTLQNRGKEVKSYISTNNISVVQSDNQLFIPWIDGDYTVTLKEGEQILNCITYRDAFLYIEECKKDNVAALLTDELLHRIVDIPYDKSFLYENNVVYSLGNYHFWYYVDIPNIGAVAKVFDSQRSAHIDIND